MLLPWCVLFIRGPMVIIFYLIIFESRETFLCVLWRTLYVYYSHLGPGRILSYWRLCSILGLSLEPPDPLQCSFTVPFLLGRAILPNLAWLGAIEEGHERDKAPCSMAALSTEESEKQPPSVSFQCQSDLRLSKSTRTCLESCNKLILNEKLLP